MPLMPNDTLPTPITHAGPQGYEFQYAATCLLGLENLSEAQSKLLVEHGGAEDAELSFVIDSNLRSIDIQAKSSQDDLSLSEFASFLAHFTPYKADQNLLSHLQNDPNRSALFVVGGRCRDALRPFLVNVGDLTPHEQNPLDEYTFIDLLGCLEKAWDKRNPSPLDTKRAEFCRKQAQDICVLHIKPSAKPVFVKEKSNRFYVRPGNMKQELQDPKLCDYIGRHWRNS
jgi:hypothetical protein